MVDLPASRGDSEPVSLLAAVRVLRERWWIVVLCLVLGIAVLAGLALTQTKEYEASSSVVVQPSQVSGVISPSSVSDDRERDQATALLLVTSTAVGDRVAKAIGGDRGTLLGQVDAVAEPDADLIEITATDEVPQRAAQIANAFAQQFVASRQAAEKAQFSSAAEELRTQRDALPTTATEQRSAINTALATVLTQGAAATGGATVADRADPASQRERQAALEPYRILRNGLSLLSAEREPRVVVVTSAVPGEGKSTVAAGLARAVALSGQSVVLVEADLRRPTFRTQFGLQDTRGLTTALVGGVPVQSVVSTVLPGLRSLTVLPSGPIPPNAAELLRSAEFSSILQDLQREADVVVLDAPPLLPVADAQVLLDNPQIDCCLIVGRAFRTTREEARRTRAVLQRHRQRNFGLVVNALRDVDASYDYYGALEEPASARAR